MKYSENLKLKTIILLAFLLVLCSCEKSTDGPIKVKKNIPFYPGDEDIKYQLFAYQVLYEGVALSEYDTLTYSRYLPSNIHFYTVEQADSAFFNFSKIEYKQDGNFYNFGDTILYQNNTWNYFDVYGNNYTGTIHDSILSPKSFGIVTFPTNKSIIDKDSNLTITWDSDNSLEDIIILISPEVNSNHGGDIYIETNDDGSYTVLANTLANLPAGLASINFMRGRYKVAQATDNNYYIISVWSEHQFMVFIK
jgi:hypothetical protein